MSKANAAHPELAASTEGTLLWASAPAGEAFGVVCHGDMWGVIYFDGDVSSCPCGPSFNTYEAALEFALTKPMPDGEPMAM